MKFIYFLFLTAALCVPLAAQAVTADDYYSVGSQFYQQGQLDKAIQYCQAAIQMNPNYWQAYQVMGYCYYSQKNNPQAIQAMDKSLQINPDNPTLQQFDNQVRSVTPNTPPAPTTDNSEVPPMANPPITSPASNTASATSTSNKFEFDINAGLALDNSQIGFGGGLDGYLPIDKNFLVGASLGFYTFSSGASASSDGETASASASLDFIEALAQAKYVFGGEKMRQYFFAGLGVADVTTSASESASNGTESASASASESQIDPLFSLGGGLEFPAGKDMNIIVQLKESLVLIPGVTETEDVSGETETITTGGGTVSYTILEGGLNFDL